MKIYHFLHKLRTFNGNVKAILLYGSEIWRDNSTLTTCQQLPAEQPEDPMGTGNQE